MDICPHCGKEIKRPIQLTAKLKQVAALVLEGHDNKEIGKQMGISPRTVKAHVGTMFRRFGIKDGIKRVKLLRLLWEIENSTETENSQKKNSALSNS